MLLTPADSRMKAATRLVEEGTPVVLFDARLKARGPGRRSNAAALGHERSDLSGPADMRQSCSVSLARSSGSA